MKKRECFVCGRTMKYANEYGDGYCEECASEHLNHSDKYGCMVDESGGKWHLTLGGFVREKRLKLGMAQPEFARDVGLTIVTISQVENGKRIGLNVQKKLAKYFEMTPGQIRDLQW